MRSTERARARATARASRRPPAIALLAAFNVLALFSIGVFVLPVTLLLAWSALLTRPGGTAYAPR